MRYRRDVPLDLIDQHGSALTDAVIEHICQHLLGATHPNDEPVAHGLIGQPGGPQLTLHLRDHETDPDIKCFIGEIDAEPNAPYLSPGFDPDLDHPEIEFVPYRNPDAGQHYNQDAYLRWITHGHHERRES